MPLLYADGVKSEFYTQLPLEMHEGYVMQQGDKFLYIEEGRLANLFNPDEYGEVVYGYDGYPLTRLIGRLGNYTYWIRNERAQELKVNPRLTGRRKIPLNPIHSEPLPLP